MILIAVILAAPTVGLPAASAQSPAGRPNVVLIVADYMGYGDIGPHGVTDIRTPAIDRLAREDVRILNAYGPAPICSPSRVGLLTGRYPQRAGFEDNVGPEPQPAGLPVGETTIATMLRDAATGPASSASGILGSSLGSPLDATGSTSSSAFSTGASTTTHIAGSPDSQVCTRTTAGSTSRGTRPTCSPIARSSSSSPTTTGHSFS